MTDLDKVRVVRDTFLKALDEGAVLLARIADALGTGETGDGLVEVARKAHRAERILSQLEIELQDEHDIEEDGGPNEAMRWSSRIDEISDRLRALEN